ncbi:MAG: organomercurial lyase [Burkholderiales bacterium]
MPETNRPALDLYWEALDAQLPRFSAEEQRIAVTLYRELAKGQPVDASQLGRALGASAAEARRFLERDAIRSFVFPDEQGRVLGFGGLAAAPMHHRLEVDGRALWTWCAWDTLFIPEILGKRARVASPDPDTKALVELVVTPQRIESAAPEGALVSFLMPEAGDFDAGAANVMKTFCHFVFFFASSASGEHWVRKHPGTFLYSLDDAFALAKRLNARNFGFQLS